MNFDIIDHAFKQTDLNPTERLVLLALAYRTNYKGNCSPYIRTLIKDTGYSRRTIFRTLAALSEKNIIEIKNHANIYNRKGNTYAFVGWPPCNESNKNLKNNENYPQNEVNIPVQEMNEKGENEQELNRMGATEDTYMGATEDTYMGATEAPFLYLNNNIITPIVPIKNKKPKKATLQKIGLTTMIKKYPVGDEEIKCKEAIEKIFEFLNEQTGGGYRPFHKSGKITANGKKLLDRLQDYSPGEILKTIRRKVEDWKGTPRAIYLRPDTLFRPSKFENYVGAPDV